MTPGKKIELLAPAVNYEKLEIAIHYGADAVYIAGKNFSLRNFSGNFTLEELEKGVRFAHEKGVKIYVACNIYSRNFEQKEITEYLKKLSNIWPDAVIVADPGIFMEAREVIPDMALHLSTQANTTNYKTALFWEKLGIKRINTARELTLREIKNLASNSSVEIEAFVHGAMCISYSGRCLLSSFLSNRDSNRGMCSHPCRWKYAVVEEKRPGEYMPVREDDRGSYIFNSKDLCMIEHIPEMIESGISSLKIEGRMKGINYVASTVKIYREAIDCYYEHTLDYVVKKEWIKELERVNYRGYCTGFYFGDPDQKIPACTKSKPGPEHTFIAKVISNDKNKNVQIEVRNKIFKGDIVEVFSINGPAREDTIKDIIDQNGQTLSFAQPGSRVTVLFDHQYSPNDLIRRACNTTVHKAPDRFSIASTSTSKGPKLT